MLQIESGAYAHKSSDFCDRRLKLLVKQFQQCPNNKEMPLLARKKSTSELQTFTSGQTTADEQQHLGRSRIVVTDYKIIYAGIILFA